MKTVSMLELRQNTGAIVSDLQRGLTLTLTYRGKPLARLLPIAAEEEVSADDPLYTLAEHAEPGPKVNGKKPPTNPQIDRILYGNP